MEEKVIVKGSLGNIALTRNIICLSGVVLGILYMIWGVTVAGYTVTTTGVFLVLLVFVLPFALIGLLFHAWASKVSLTVTDKRVYGTAAFGKRVDLPFDKINAVGSGMFNTVHVTTASGSIKFAMIKNKEEVYSAISRLLVERQNKPAGTTTIKQEIPQSAADELKKYKDLLDSGTITQGEFDAKKKQLLGL